MFRGAVTFGVLVAGLVTLACSSGGDDGASPDSEDGFTRTASAGSIEVEATWIGAGDEMGADLTGYPPDRFLLLEVKLDTHSGDLGSIDMVEGARLRTGAGSIEPEAWVASSDDAHHRAGVLVFGREGVTGSFTLSLELGDETAELAWEELPES